MGAAERLFLGWDRPFLHLVRDYFFEHWTGGAEGESEGELDLSRVVLCFSIGRAGRRFLELCVERAEQDSLRFIPPQTITLGVLPEYLTGHSRPHAPSLVRLSFWEQALRNLDPAQLTVLLGREQKSDAREQPPFDLFPFAEELESLYVELSGADVSPERVAPAAAELGSEISSARWGAIAEVIRSYESLISEAGYYDKHLERRRKLESGDLFSDSGELFLAGVPDLNEISKKLLVASPVNTRVLCFAPDELAGGFDEHGALLPEFWQGYELPLSKEQCHRRRGPGELARAVVAEVAACSEGRTVEAVTLGMVDSTLTAPIEQTFEQEGVQCRSSSGHPITETRPVRLLRLVTQFIERRMFADFAHLLRHPDYLDAVYEVARENELALPTDLLTFLDTFHTEHLQARFTFASVGSSEERAVFDVLEKVNAILLGELLAAPRPLAEWQDPFLHLLRQVFGRRLLSERIPTEKRVLEVCRKLKDQIVQLEFLQEREARPVSANQAMRLVLRAVRSEVTHPDPEEEAIEMLGWLELPLDDAPCLMIAGCNEELLPESINAHPFLPNTLRTKLGLVDNDRRFARDVCSLAALLASRETVQLFLTDTNGRGEMLLPSRLLLQVPLDELPDRALYFYQGEPTTEAGSLFERVETLSGKELAIPRPGPLADPIRKLSVTSFKDYLRCPYRFYLKHICRLRSSRDDVHELDPPGFGSLLHVVLEEFAQSARVDCTDADEIFEGLQHSLRTVSKRRFGKEPLPAVLIQLFQIEQRLRAFAGWQASRSQAGWRIAHSEFEIEPGTLRFSTAQGEVDVVGRIDRIDHHPDSGAWAVFDYKTGDAVLSPAKTHVDSEGNWTDFQLPLYQAALRGSAIGGSLNGPLELGYILLPRALDEVGAQFAAWEETELTEAITQAEEIACKIAGGEFWPPTEEMLAFDDFAAICGMDLYQTALSDEVDESAGEFA